MMPHISLQTGSPYGLFRDLLSTARHSKANLGITHTESLFAG